MKTLTKWLIGSSALIAGAVAYRQYANDKKQLACQKSLANASQLIADDEQVVGTWIDMNTQVHSDLGVVFVGGITTQSNTYDFISHAQTSEVLVFEKQVRD